ncbi:MAG: hypothetical protein IJG53_05555 [Eggerthellaceae bacterium]|nr:hypothetical protein [Achromobacter sp.]MBQ3386773.1 hypothetical protein [Eggerthellaceae bacterium]
MVIAGNGPILGGMGMAAPGSGGFGMGMGMGMGAPGAMGGARFNPQDAVCGGTIDHTDPAAPKKIASREITDFSTLFRVYDLLTRQIESHWFTLKRLDDGTYELATYDGGHRVITGPETALAVRDILDEHGLIAMNGIDRVTQGLPSEFQPIFLNADFASGEHLHFVVNGYPRNCDWGLALKRLFAKVYAAAGDGWLEPPAEARRITRFHLEVSKGPLDVSYGVITFPGEGEDARGNRLPDVQRYYRMAYDTEARCSAGSVYLDYDPRLLERLQPVVETAGLNGLPTTPINFSLGSDPAGRVDLFIDYANGRQIYRQYRGAGIPPEWPAMQEALCGFLDAEFDARGYAIER